MVKGHEHHPNLSFPALISALRFNTDMGLNFWYVIHWYVWYVIYLRSTSMAIWRFLPPGGMYRYPRTLSVTSNPLNLTSGSSCSLSCLGFLSNRPLSMISQYSHSPVMMFPLSVSPQLKSCSELILKSSASNYLSGQKMPNAMLPFLFLL